MITMGYIGLGNIGKPMCASLIKNVQDAQVLVYDVFAEPIAEMVSLGGVAAASPREIAERCQYIGVCVRDDNDVKDLLYTKGMLDAMKPDTVIAIHSTVTRGNVLTWAKECSSRGVYLLDAGITGGERGAREAQLCIMVGGDKAATERAQVMFGATSKKVVYCGESGSGIAVKLANNMYMYQCFVAGREAADLVRSVGVEPQCLVEVGQANGVMQPVIAQYLSSLNALMAAGVPAEMKKIYEIGFSLGYKDMGYALELAEQQGLDLSTAARAKEKMAAVFFQD